MRHSKVMRTILVALKMDVERAAAVYAALEQAGLLPRDSNVENWPALRYARSLAHNEVRKHSHLM